MQALIGICENLSVSARQKYRPIQRQTKSEIIGANVERMNLSNTLTTENRQSEDRFFNELPQILSMIFINRPSQQGVDWSLLDTLDIAFHEYNRDMYDNKAG